MFNSSRKLAMHTSLIDMHRVLEMSVSSLSYVPMLCVLRVLILRYVELSYLEEFEDSVDYYYA